MRTQRGKSPPRSGYRRRRPRPPRRPVRPFRLIANRRAHFGDPPLPSRQKDHAHPPPKDTDCAHRPNRTHPFTRRLAFTNGRPVGPGRVRCERPVLSSRISAIFEPVLQPCRGAAVRSLECGQWYGVTRLSSVPLASSFPTSFTYPACHLLPPFLCRRPAGQRQRPRPYARTGTSWCTVSSCTRSTDTRIALRPCSPE